jgi:two-component system, OmpR family, sensor histidine kinase QseC
MNSLRRRLFLILAASTSVIWLCGFFWIYTGTKAQLQHVLDTRLQEAARMVNSLVGEGGAAAIAGGASASAPSLNYERQLSCQIWSLDGQLLARSDSAPDVLLTDGTPGFSDRVIKGEPWRVYLIENAAHGVRVMVGDRLGQRDQLVASLIKGLLLPALVIIPLLGLLIWASLRRGLKPLSDMAAQLQARDVDDMSPLNAQSAPSEIRPLAAALNALFFKVEAARRHEREVTAFAAHELRTPLAGLKIQAQIAMSAADPDIRNTALSQLVVSIDRTARLVRQLLVLAKFDAGLEPSCPEKVSVGAVLADVIDAVRPLSGQIHVVVDPALRDFVAESNRELLTLVLRNLYENAVQHTPEGGAVSWTLAPESHAVVLTDEGPGIPEAELPLVSQRFFQGTHRSVSGCGLGLSIIESAVRMLGGTFALNNRQERSGLRVVLVLPSFSVRLLE